MSLYNLVNGIQMATFFVLPMLGKHPDEYPRFRDCFMGKVFTDGELNEYKIPVKKHGNEELISVYTRVGGGNRNDYEKEIVQLKLMPEYVSDFDDNFDNTFATFVFNVPDKFKDDFHKIKEGRILDTSQEYKDILYKVYPKLKEKFDELFIK